MFHFILAAFLILTSGVSTFAQSPGTQQPLQRRPFQQFGPAQSQMLLNVELKKDLNYAGDNNPRHNLDLAIPKDREAGKKLPILVFIHGGGWQNGSKEQSMRQVIPFAAQGKCAAISINYRLSGESQWPTQIHDCKAAIRWIKAHADEYGLDGEKIVVWGSSAGGHLVAMLGLTGPDDGLEGNVGEHLDQKTKVAGVINYFGPYDLSDMSGPTIQMDHTSPNSPESKMLGKSVADNKEWALSASPKKYVSAGDAPFLIAHGTVDPVVPFGGSVELHNRLKEVGVPSCLITVEGGSHGFQTDEKMRTAIDQFIERCFAGSPPQLDDFTVVPNGRGLMRR